MRAGRALWWPPVLVAALTFLAAATPVTSQAQSVVGTVKEIRDLESGERLDRTDRARTTPPGGTTWTELFSDADIVGEVEMQVHSFLNLRVEVDEGDNRGRLIFTTDLKNEQSPGARIFPDQPVDSSVYVVRQGFRGPEVDIEEGTLVVEWEEGVVTITAAGHVIPIEGTSAAFHVFPGGDSAFVYLGSGVLTFQNSGVQAADHTLYKVRRAPSLLPLEVQNPQLTPGDIAAWDDVLELHGSEIWGSPGFLGLGWRWWGLGAVAGGGCAVLRCWEWVGGGDSVVIQIQLPF